MQKINKSKLKKIMLSCATLLVTALALGACSQKSSSTDKTPSQNQKPQQEKIVFAKMANENKTHLWYKVHDEDGLSKNSKISEVVVTKNGKTTVYVLNQDVPNNISEDGSGDHSHSEPDARYMTLQDASKLSDKQILTKVKKSDKKFFGDEQSFASKFLKFKKEKAKTDDMTKDELNGRNGDKPLLTSIINAKYKPASRDDLRVNVFTDDTGQDVTTEILHTVSFGDYFDNRDEDQPDKLVPDTQRYRMTGTMSAPKQVLDQYYAGYFMPDSHYFLTRSTKNAQVNFDKQKTKGIFVLDD